MGQSIFFRTDIFILYNFLYFQKISSTYWTTYRYSCDWSTDKCANEDPAGLQQHRTYIYAVGRKQVSEVC